MTTTRDILIEVVRRCDIVLNEKIGAEAPSPGPRMVAPPQLTKEVGQ